MRKYDLSVTSLRRKLWGAEDLIEPKWGKAAKQQLCILLARPGGITARSPNRPCECWRETPERWGPQYFWGTVSKVFLIYLLKAQVSLLPGVFWKEGGRGVNGVRRVLEWTKGGEIVTVRYIYVSLMVHRSSQKINMIPFPPILCLPNGNGDWKDTVSSSGSPGPAGDWDKAQHHCFCAITCFCFPRVTL